MRMRNVIAFSMLIILSGCFTRSKPGSSLTGSRPANVEVQTSGSITNYPKIPMNNTTLVDFRLKGHCDSGVDFDFSLVAKPGDTKPVSSDTCRARLMALKFQQGAETADFKRHEFTNTEWDMNAGDTIRMKDDARKITLFVKIDKPLVNPVQPSSTIEYSFTSILQGNAHDREEQRISIDSIKVDGVDAPLFELKYSYRALDQGELRLKFDLECLQAINANKCYNNDLSDISYVLVPNQTGVAPSSLSEIQEYFDSRTDCHATTPTIPLDAAYETAEDQLRAAEVAVSLATAANLAAKKQDRGTKAMDLWTANSNLHLPITTTTQYCTPLRLLPATTAHIDNGGFSTPYMEVLGDLRKKQRLLLILRAQGTGVHNKDYSYSVYPITITP